MFKEVISEDRIVIQSGTSEGSQIKYYQNGCWYKKDQLGREGLAEYLCSRLLTFSSLPASEYIVYEQGTINGQDGCRSKNFLQEDEELITFYRLYYNDTGQDLSRVIGQMETMEERIDYVIAFMKQSCHLDIRDYLRRVLTLDMVVLNEDRHLNNLAVIQYAGQYRPAPIFDNGVSLLTANQSVNWNFGMEENVRRIVARPFCGSHRKMVDYLGVGFALDSESARRWLSGEKASREKEVLLYQIERYADLLKGDK